MILETTSLSNQNISASLLTGSWTATRGTSIFARLFAGSLIGTGENYIAFCTLQRGGAGYIYRMLPATTASAGVGVQHICMTTIEVPISNADIIKTYLIGASTDTASVNLVTEIWEGGLLGASAISASNIATGAIRVGVLGASAIGASNLAGSTINATVYDDNVSTTTGSAVWSYATRTLTQTAATVAAVMSGSSVTATRGDTLSATITGMGNISSRTKLWFTVKDSYDNSDTSAIIQIEETAGLVYMNGVSGTSGNGSITVDDATAGDITITLSATETAKLTKKSRVYDVQMLTTTTVQTMTSGIFEVDADVTKATS